ncbi:TlpA family protein disulfide reductase [Echinicola strongylocentroti]|uniref:TlpA family protein disulfide reductase n=1 Tax=Echinicola strongylocentroti TaxID=1795355 RepID=A0A2Z4INS2_9BACT|nr:TlpA disulfide reductase family protein [Echinicola strongylocentroti]AWW32555.1 TlpA family protein disulfide reductase [Echinicola strongylocentroti]
MKKGILSFFLATLLFIVTFYLSAQLLSISRDYSLWGVGALLGFILIFVIDTLYIQQLAKFLPSKWTIFISLFGVLLFAFISLPSLRFATKVLPTVISFVLGVLAAAVYASGLRKRYLYTFLIALFPFLLNLNIYSTWVHYIEFGNTSGEVSALRSVPFSALDKNGKEVNSEQLKGKVVLLDFWFIGCAPCWKKFPDLQRFHEQYGDHPEVAIFAINRPMASDHPGQSFESIQKKGYDFNVLQGDQKIMDDFGIYVYPTVVVLNKDGKIIFMGQLDEAITSVEEALQE